MEKNKKKKKKKINKQTKKNFYPTEEPYTKPFLNYTWPKKISEKPQMN